MTLSIENLILLPGEIMLWQGPETPQPYQRYYLTDERLLVQTSRTTYKSFDLSQIVAIDYEDGRSFSYLTLTPFKGETPYLTIKLPPGSRQIYLKFEEARRNAVYRVQAEGEQVASAVRVSGAKFILYSFIRQNALLFLYFLLALLALEFNLTPLGLLWPVILWSSLLLFSSRQGRQVIDKMDQWLRGLFFKVSSTERLVVGRKLAKFCNNLMLIFWSGVFLLIFLCFFLLI